MDYSDSLDSLHTKCNRVRSWYLYEQYKSLEKNQIDAANRLKNRTYQERILKQELYERRARRSLCDQFNEIRSDTGLENIHNIRRIASLSCVSDEDFFESFNELHEEYELDPEHGYTYDSNTSKNYEFDKCMEKNNSHLTNFAGDVPNDLYATDTKQKIDCANKNINFQLNPVKANIELLEKRTKLDGSDKVTDSESFYEICNCDSKLSSRDLKDKLNGSTDNCVLFVWSKLVAFAYNIIKLNHDNCYYDCSSQFLIGILMCDVLRRGISNMCNILQPYVSPIKYCASDTDILMENKEDKSRKNNKNYNKYLKATNGTKINKWKRNKSPKKLFPLDRKYHSEIKWQNPSKHSSDNYYPSKIKCHGASEPWCSTNKLCEKERSCKLYNEWPDTIGKCGIFEENNCECRCVKRVVDPILQIARYIDSILQDIDEIKNL